MVADHVWEEVERRVVKEFGPKNSDQNVSLVRECLKKRDHITVFRQDGGASSSSGKDIDVAILRALLKGSLTLTFVDVVLVCVCCHTEWLIYRRPVSGQWRRP